MRPDYLVYRKATQVAGWGLLIQLAISLALMIFGLVTKDTALVFASFYTALGLLVWLSLIVVFYQHGLERLESLDDDEAARSGAPESVFASEGDDVNVAARRLKLMHKWAMPIVSILLALLFVYLGWSILDFFQRTKLPDESATDFLLTTHRGWAIAICLAAALISFIFSRFAAGMAKVNAWQNLRGGASFMAGNAIVTLALAVGIIFRFFDNDSVIEGITRALPYFLFVVAFEIALNFVLNLYRPRIAGEVPRPAFDSRILSYLATPDSIVRSVNEAVNYQFGFDIASSWGYQLLLRSLGWLLLIGVVSLVLLNTMVIVEPHQQGVRLRAGSIVGDRVYESGIMWKWPWPFETAELYDVGRIRELSLTGRQTRIPDVSTWSDELRTNVPLDPFIVTSPRIQRLGTGRLGSFAGVDVVPAALEPAPPGTDGEDDTGVPAKVVDLNSTGLALVTAEIVMQYRIRSENNGLIKYLAFAPDSVQRRQSLSQRERSIKSLALREVSQYLLTVSFDDVMATKRSDVSTALRDRIQNALDTRGAGVEVVSVDLVTVRPAGDSAADFEDIAFAIQERQRREAEAQQRVTMSLAAQAGDVKRADELIREIKVFRNLEQTKGRDDPETIEQRSKVEELFAEAGGIAAQMLLDAEADRWTEQMGARGQAHRVAGEAMPYLAAPELYRQRKIMEVYVAALGAKGTRKYILGIDASRLQIDFDVSQLTDMFNFGEMMETDTQGSSQ